MSGVFKSGVSAKRPGIASGMLFQEGQLPEVFGVPLDAEHLDRPANGWDASGIRAGRGRGGVVERSADTLVRIEGLPAKPHLEADGELGCLSFVGGVCELDGEGDWGRLYGQTKVRHYFASGASVTGQRASEKALLASPCLTSS